MKDYLEHLGYHYSDPDQCLACSMCKVYIDLEIDLHYIDLHYIDLEIGNVDYVFIFIDIDMVILEINSESLFISIIFK